MPTSKPETLQKPSTAQAVSSEKTKPWTEGGFVPDDDRAWKAAIANTASSRKDVLDIWKIGGTDLSRTGEQNAKEPGFVDDFAEKLWESFEDKSNNLPTQIKANPHLNRSKTVVSTRAHARPSTAKKDAFEGLGFELSDRPPPTLGEARKLRTGLAILSTRPNGSDDKVGASSSRLSPPRQPNLSSSPSKAPFLSSGSRPSSSASGMSWRTSPQPAARSSSSVQPETLPAETRFPSLEDLDATFASSSENTSRTTKSHVQQASGTPALPPRNSRFGRSAPGTSGLSIKPAVQPLGSYGADGVRSEQVTGVAMREFRSDTNDRRGGPSEGRADGPSRVEGKAASGSHPPSQSNPAKRPSLTRKHRSSTTIKQAPTEDISPTSPLASFTAENLVSRSPRLPTESKDWLTGADDHQEASSASVLVPTAPMETLVFRESPSKRASVIQKSTVPIQDAIFPQHDHTPVPQRTPSPFASAPSDISPTISRFTRAFPPIETTDRLQRDKVSASTQDRTPVATRTARKPVEPESSSSADEGPEDVGGFKRTPVKAPASIGKPKRKGRQSSVHDLVDLWGGGVAHKDNEQTLTPRTAPNDSATSSQGLKARLVASPLSSAKSNPTVKTTMLSPPGIDSRIQQAPNSDPRRSPLSGDATHSASSRSRPQSMIIFPSKSTDTYLQSAGYSSTSASLVPPSTSSQRTGVRRTSISNIVQRYEGISGKGQSAGSNGPPSPNASKSVAKAESLLTENGRYSKGLRQKDQVGLLPPVSSDASYRRRSSSPSEDTRMSPSPSPINAPSPLPHDAIQRGSEDVVPRAPKLSFNRENREMSKPVFTSGSKPVEDPSSRPGDERSSSPERPYQGVGKLIDQWQRKTAEASATRNPIGRGRGSVVGTRSQHSK
jgi:AP2-associated kinase